MKLTNKEKLAEYWNHKINPITGWKLETRGDKAVVERKEANLWKIHEKPNN